MAQTNQQVKAALPSLFRHSYSHKFRLLYANSVALLNQYQKLHHT
jgi:hypothetical protein